MIFYCNECKTILFKIQNGCIIMVSRHHGKQHINVIPIAKLVEQAEKEGSSDDRVGHRPGIAPHTHTDYNAAQ